MALRYYTRGTTGLYRVEQPKAGGFHNPERWNGAEWVGEKEWIEDLMEGRLDVNGDDPADIAAHFPGAVRSA